MQQTHKATLPNYNVLKTNARSIAHNEQPNLKR